MRKQKRIIALFTAIIMLCAYLPTLVSLANAPTTDPQDYTVFQFNSALGITGEDNGNSMIVRYDEEGEETLTVSGTGLYSASQENGNQTNWVIYSKSDITITPSDNNATITYGGTVQPASESYTINTGNGATIIDCSFNTGNQGQPTGASYTVNFGTAQWVIGESTITASIEGKTINDGDINILDTDVIQLSDNFDSRKMMIKATADDGFNLELNVNEDKTTSLANKPQENSFPANQRLTITVEQREVQNNEDTITLQIDGGTVSGNVITFNVNGVNVTATVSGNGYSFNGNNLQIAVNEINSLVLTFDNNFISNIMRLELHDGQQVTINGNNEATFGNLDFSNDRAPHLQLVSINGENTTATINYSVSGVIEYDEGPYEGLGINFRLNGTSYRPGNVNYTEDTAYERDDYGQLILDENNNPIVVKDPETMQPMTEKTGVTVTGDTINYNSDSDTVRFLFMMNPGTLMTGLKINNQTINNLPSTAAELEACYTDHMIEIEVANIAKADTYNIEVEARYPNSTEEFIGNFLWDYDPQGYTNPDDKILNGTLTFVKAVYDNHTYITEDEVNALGGVYIWRDAERKEIYTEEREGCGEAQFPVGTELTVKIIPDAGYQLVSFGINGGNFEPQEEIGTYTFVVQGGPFHLQATIEQVDDAINITSEKVDSGNVTINGNEDSMAVGTARLDVSDINLTQEQISNFEDAANGYNISNYINISLYNTVYKGNETDSWDTEVKTLQNDATITLKLKDEIDGNNIIIVHDIHNNGTYEIIEVESYDPITNTITFKTSSFSNYAVASKTSDTPTPTTKYKVTFDTDGGSEIEEQEITAGGAVAKPANPTKDGFEFIGWFADKTCLVPFDFEEELEEKVNNKINANTVLYAGWEDLRTAHTITAVANGINDIGIIKVKNGDEFITSNTAKVGDIVRIWLDEEKIPEGKYIADVTYNIDVEFENIPDVDYLQFTMLDEDVVFTLTLADQKEYTIDLTNGPIDVPTEIMMVVYDKDNIHFDEDGDYDIVDIDNDGHPDIRATKPNENNDFMTVELLESTNIADAKYILMDDLFNYEYKTIYLSTPVEAELEEIEEVNITLTAPTIGDTVTVEEVDHGGFGGPEPNIFPVVNEEENANYEIVWKGWVKGTYTTAGDEFEDLFEGTFEENTDYYAEIFIDANEGYKLSNDLTIKINGEAPAEVFPIYENGANTKFIAKIKAVAAPHTHTLVKTDKVDATCTEDGMEAYYTCSGCGKYFEDATGTVEIEDLDTLVIEALDHDWDEGTITTPATCTETGVKTFTCTRNNTHTKTEVVAIDPDAHEWNEGVVTTEPTYFAEGVKTYTCKHNSSHTKTEPIAKLEVEVEAADSSSESKAAAEEVSKLIEKIIANEDVERISDDLKETIIEALTLGDEITIEIEIEAINEEEIEEDAEKIQEKIGEKGTVAKYFNIEVILKINGVEEDKITELGNAIKLSVAIPNDLPEVEQGYTRKFTVVRVHEGVAKELATTVKNNKAEFESNEFSTYALTYTDVQNPAPNTPQTGDNIMIVIAIMAVSGLGLLLTTKYLKKRK